MIPDSPIRLAPVFRSYLWGGNRLSSILNKNTPGDGPWAESWEVVDHGSDQSTVLEASWQGWSLRQLIESFPDAILGPASPSRSFPLLLKYLDCNRVLSVQVHPNDEQGRLLPTPDLGKTEAWYVLHAEPHSKIYAGLRPGFDRSKLEEWIQNGQTEECLHVLKPKKDDCVFIPAGTVHALGEGLVVAEIQQASDTTFRLFDWNRVDSDGKPRPLHIQQALDVIDFECPSISFAIPSPSSNGHGETLVRCDKFVLERYRNTTTWPIELDHLFRIVTVPHGRVDLECHGTVTCLQAGESCLIPAKHAPTHVTLEPDTLMLVARLPS